MPNSPVDCFGSTDALYMVLKYRWMVLNGLKVLEGFRGRGVLKGLRDYLV